MKIVFFGTPEFAAYSLRSLVEHHREVVAVVTMPDKPKGRGHKLQPSDVKRTAQELVPEVPILQPERLRDGEFLERLREIGADLFIVVAFRMLPEEVWDMPLRGTINLHAALLPKYRGAAPIQWALINGELETGVTTFLLDKEIDTGRVLLQERVPISADETGGTLHDRLMVVGAKVIEETIDLIEQSRESKEQLGRPQPEDVSHLPMAPKIFKEEQTIRFTTMSAEEIDRRVRAMAPYPKAVALFHNETSDEEVEIKILSVSPDCERQISRDLAPGESLETDGKRLFVGTAKGTIELLELQWPSSKVMPTRAFLLGHSPFPRGTFL